MSVQKPPGGERQNPAPAELAEPKEIQAGPRHPDQTLIDYKGFKLVPDPPKKKHHPLVEAGLTVLKFPLKLFLEWPMDALDRLQQRSLDRKNKEMGEKAERHKRLQMMNPKEKPKKPPEQ
jgi:hypothetical protein